MNGWILVSEVLRNFALAAAAGVGAFLAWRKLGPETKQAGTAVAQAELARRAHVVELFNRAAGQLGDERLEVRLAAIYVLREVARDFPDLAKPVFDLLQAYLKLRKESYGTGSPPVDVLAIVEVLRLRTTDDET